MSAAAGELERARSTVPGAVPPKGNSKGEESDDSDGDPFANSYGPVMAIPRYHSSASVIVFARLSVRAMPGWIKRTIEN